MSNKQPEALALAELLRNRYGHTVPTSQAAALLERQHALNAELVEALRGALSMIESSKERIGYVAGSIYDKNVKRYSAVLAKAEAQQ